MILALSTSGEVSAGALIAIGVGMVTFISTGVGVIVTIKSGGPWRSLAEGYEKRLLASETENKQLHKRVGELEGRPTYEDLLGAVRDIALVLQSIQETQLMIDGRLDKHAREAAARWEAIMNRIEAMERPPTSRSRASDRGRAP